MKKNEGIKLSLPKTKEIILNKQYSYTDMESFISSLAKYDGWLMTKQGLTLAQEIEERKNQQDNASSTADIIVFSTLVVEGNSDPKLDDKIREELHKTDEFMHYERYNNKSKKHEWSLVKIDDLVENFDELRNEFIKLQTIKNTLSEKTLENFISKNFLFNEEFIKALDKRVFKAKQKAVMKILGKESFKDIILRPWQQETVDEMIKADKYYNLLSLAPRFGKTITILEYMLLLSRMLGKRLVLLPASKNLASNSSFDEDFINAGYKAKDEFDICTGGSLYVASNEKDVELSELIERRIKILKGELSEDAMIVLVTDEADIASHTENSVEFIEAIKSNFNVIKQIAMSGTGIFKAAKIFKGVPEKEIFFKSMNYTELSGYGVIDLVKRKFYNVKYEMQDMIDNMKLVLENDGKDLSDLTKKDAKLLETFNINQAFNQVSAWPNLAKYIRSFVDGDAVNKLELQDAKAIMVFTPSRTVKGLKKFIKTFNKLNPDVATLEISGNETNNREAQALTKEKLSTMRKMKDDRKLVIFSRDMGSRSYSIPEIRRVLIMGDGEINAAWYQKSARGLTYNYGQIYTNPNQVGEIIRISFSNLDLASELFLLENDKVKRDDQDTKTKVERQLTRNSFVDVTVLDDEDFDIDIIKYGSNEDTVIAEIDKMLKYTDTTKYIMTQLFDLDLDTDSNIKAAKKNKIKISSVNINVPNIKTKNNNKKTVNIQGAMTTDDEKALELYVDVIRTLPYVGKAFGASTLDDLLTLNWQDIMIIEKEQFQNNLKEPIFKSVVESIFRNSANEDEIIKEKVQKYLSLKA